MRYLLGAREADTKYRGVYSRNRLGQPSPGIRKLIVRIVAAFILLSALLASFLCFSSTTINAQTADPDSVQFIAVHVNNSLYEPGDYMLMLHYAVNYTVLPSDPINETFIFRLIDTDGTTELGAATAYPFADDGYGQGVVTLYWDADKAPAWDGLYILRISGNPSAFVNPPVYNYTLTPQDYSSAEDQDENREDMATWLLDVAMALEIAWDASLLDLTDTGVVLSTVGESYFRYAIPGLQVLAPELFYVYVAQPNWEGRDWGTDQGAAYTSRYEGTWVGRALKDGADLFGGTTTMVFGMFILGLCIGFVILSAKYFQTTLPGFMAGVAITTMGGLMGWISPAMLGVIGLAFALYIGYFLLFQRA